MNIQRTLVIIKHDGVARGLMGEIIKRFERVGLKMVALELIESTNEMGDAHYPPKEDWLRTVGNRTLDEYREKGIDAVTEIGSDDPMEIGRSIRNWLIEYLAYGPVLAMIWEGPNAIPVVRKLIGDARPVKALPGTIRGDFGLDDPEIANAQKRPIYNLIHASGEIAEAEQEIKLWFSSQEVINYDTYASHFLGINSKMNREKKRT